MLNAHPRIALAGELDYFPLVYEPYGGSGAAGWKEATTAFLAICNARLRPHIDLAEVKSDLAGLSEPNFASLLSMPMMRWAAAQGKTRWGEKTPLHMFYPDMILELFPTARVIVVSRDPRAVVASMKRFEDIGDDTVLNAFLWNDVWTTGRDWIEKCVPVEQRFDLSYEKLTIAPNATAKELCEFLGEDYSESMLTFGETAHRFVHTIKSKKIAQPITAQLDSWRSVLSDREVAQVEAICGETMGTLGYQPGNLQVNSWDRMVITLKRLYIHLKQRQHGQSRYHYHYVMYRPFWRGGHRVRHFISRVRLGG